MMPTEEDGDLGLGRPPRAELRYNEWARREKRKWRGGGNQRRELALPAVRRTEPWASFCYGDLAWWALPWGKVPANCSQAASSSTATCYGWGRRRQTSGQCFISIKLCLETHISFLCCIFSQLCPSFLQGFAVHPRLMLFCRGSFSLMSSMVGALIGWFQKHRCLQLTGEERWLPFATEKCSCFTFSWTLIYCRGKQVKTILTLFFFFFLQ